MRIEKKKILNIDNFLEAKSEWNALENGTEMTVYQTFDWNFLLYREWYATMCSKVVSEVVIYYLFDDVSLHIILPLIIQKHSTKTKWFGRKKGIYILGHGSYSDYLNAVYKEATSEMFDALLKRVRLDYPKLNIDFTDILETTSLNHYFMSQGIKPANKTVTVCVKKFDSVEQYTSMLSKHTRQNLRTAVNRMNTDHVNYELSVLGAIDDAELLDKLLATHIERMKVKNNNKTDFVHRVSSLIRITVREYKEKHNNVIYSSMKQMKNSCLVIVYLNSEIAGYLYGLRDRGYIRILQNCFNDKYGFYSPSFRGAYDFIIGCYDDGQVAGIDFTRGDEDYKYKLAGIETKLCEYIL